MPSRRALIVLLLSIFTLAEAAAQAARPSLCMIGKRGRYMEVAYRQELEAHGYDIDSLTWDEVSPDVLRRYNAVIITGYYEHMTKTALDEPRQRWIDEYMRKGGGVLVLLNTTGAYAGDYHPDVIRWLKTYGIDFYIESVQDPDRVGG